MKRNIAEEHAESCEMLHHHEEVVKLVIGKMPQEEDMDTLRTWAEALSAAGYEGRLSLEGGFDDFVPVINRTRPMLDVF